MSSDEIKCKLCLGEAISLLDIENLCPEHNKQFKIGTDRKIMHDEVIS